MTGRILLGAGLCEVAIAVAFVNVRLAHAVFLAMPLLYISQPKIDAHWSELIAANAKE